MATTSFGVNDPLAVKLWSKKLAVESLKQTWVYKFMGRDDNSIIQIFDDTHVIEDNTLEGNEERIAFYSDDVVINQLRHAVRTGGAMSEQRVPFELREQLRTSLQDWFADRIDTWFFNQLCGNAAVTDLRYTGMNTAVAADSAHQIYAGGAGSDASLSNSATYKFTLTLIDVAVEKAKTLEVPIRPIMIGGEEKYVAFLHPYQVTDMRTNTNTGQWLDIQKAAMQGGMVSKNPIYTGALGEYNGVILHQSTRIPGFTAGNANVANGGRIAVFAGAQAVAMAYGRGHSPERYSWKEDFFDYENQLGVAAGCISGMKKLQFNGSDFSTITMRTWASEHTTS
jgi:N4-gp56 family major capsid protein